VRVTLLGPQRRPTVDQVVRTLDPDAPLATVTAGWQEREPDDVELDRLLGGRSVNLGLYRRWLDVQERDREFATAELEHRAVLDELRLLYLVQLDAALATMYALAGRSGDRPKAIEAARTDAESVVRLIDQRHLSRVRDATEEFGEAYRLAERPVIVEHRTAVRRTLEQTAALVVAGGHVGFLLRTLQLFQVAPFLPPSVIAWSAGAMALSERVVLFHDSAPQGSNAAEIYDDGLALVHGAVLFPDARRRLRVDDPMRMAVLARRFAPARCAVLDTGVRLDLTPDGVLPESARVIGADGRIAALEDG
jgi:hypothetical protein